jgi:hypothetical protein
VKVNRNSDPPDFWLLTSSNFEISRPDYVNIGEPAVRIGRVSEYPILASSRVQTWLPTHRFAIERVPQARHVIEFSSARNICLDKLSRQLHTDWYVAGYN